MSHHKYTFQIISPISVDWQKIEHAYDSTCYHTQKWNAYLKTIGVKPLVVGVSIGEKQIGFFLGEKVWLPFPMVTAPIEGIGTYTQGLTMLVEVDEQERIDIYQELAQWIFDNHIALSFQVDDWQLRKDFSSWLPIEEFHHEEIERNRISFSVRPTLHLPVAGKSIEDLWAATSYSSCKYSVHKAQKKGLFVREIVDYDQISDFCAIHYDQLREVCARKGTHPKLAQKGSRMLALCESLFPDRVLMLQCIGKDENGVEQVMSSAIFCVDKGQSAYWTGASYKRYQRYCPNELMVWEAIRILHERGAGDLNFCGMADYKLKFGTIYAYVPRMKFAKYSFLANYTQRLKGMYHIFKRFINI